MEFIGSSVSDTDRDACEAEANAVYEQAKAEAKATLDAAEAAADQMKR